MYQVFFGNDRGSVRDAANRYLDSSMPADAQLVTIDTYNYQPGQLSDALGSTSLFGESQWFVLDTPSEIPEFQEEVAAALDALAESVNTFLILEGPLLAADKKRYTKHAASLEEFTAAKTERFNAFALADALAERDKRRLWVLMQEAKLNGQRPEDMVGILWWQLKVMRLAARTTSPDAAGMKPFPYNKAKRALGKYPGPQLTDTAVSLLNLYHAGHTGERDMDLALEEWVLTL